METNTTLPEPLLEKIESYGKSGLELLKLRSADKAAAISSALISRVFLFISISLFAVLLNLGLSLWLGELLGKTYLGFLVIAAVYGIVAVIIYALLPRIRAKINDKVIKQLLN